MILGACPNCDYSFITALDHEHIGDFLKLPCEKCGKIMWVEMSYLGKTYPEDHFKVNEQLKTLAKAEDGR